MLGLLIVELLRSDFHKFPLVIELLEKVGGKLMVNLAGGAAVDVETDTKVSKRFLDDAMIAIHHILHSASLLLCTDGHRYTMLITPTHKHHLTSLQSQVSRIDVGRYIHASQMSNVYRSIGIWQRCRHSCSLKVFLFHVLILI